MKAYVENKSFTTYSLVHFSKRGVRLVSSLVQKDVFLPCLEHGTKTSLIMISLLIFYIDCFSHFLFTCFSQASIFLPTVPLAILSTYHITNIIQRFGGKARVLSIITVIRKGILKSLSILPITISFLSLKSLIQSND